MNDVSDATFYIVVAPGTHSASSIFIELVTADNKATKIPIEQAVTFKPGICHAINLELNSADLIAKEYAHEIIVTPDSEATSQYVVTDLETGFLYTDRTYTLTNVPEKYFGWQMATTPANTRLAGTIEAKSDGKVYIITRYNKRTIMANSGWVAETPQREEDGVPIKETSTGHIVIIWSRTVAKGDIVTIPGELSDTSFGGFTPIAPRIILRDAP